MAREQANVFVVSDFGQIRHSGGLFFIELQEDFFEEGETGETVRELVLSPASFLALYNRIDASVRELVDSGVISYEQNA